MNQRNQTIDFAKGVAIILMVVGHCYHVENDVLCLIYGFHMPFFFVVSGMLYADRWKDEVRFSLLRTTQKLLIPYFVFDTLFCLFVTILGRPESLVTKFCSALTNTVIPLIGTTVTWYLPCQLLTVAIFAAGKKHLKDIVLLGVSSLAYIIAILSPPHGLVVLWRSLIGMGFFSAGFFMNKIFNQKCGLLPLSSIGLLYIVLARHNGMVSLVGLRFSEPILYTANGLLGSWLLYQICLRITCGKVYIWIEFLGKNSIIVLCTHMFFVEIIRLLDYKLFGNWLYTLGILEGAVFGAMIIGLMFPVIAVSNRYFGKLFGK